MANEAAGYICPRCGYDQQFLQELVKDEDGHIEATVLVCKHCGKWWTEHHWPTVY